MVDILNFRDEKLLKAIYESEKARGNPASIVDNILELDKKWKSTSHSTQMKKQQLNVMKREISKKKRNKEDADSEIEEMKKLKEEIAKNDTHVQQLRAELDSKLNLIGNIVHASVPVSDDEDNNDVIEKWGVLKSKNDAPLHHSEVMGKLGAYNMKAGSVVAGHRGYFLKDIGVFLNQALIQYGMNFLANHKYTVLQTPFFMASDMMAKTAQLSEYDDLLYGLGGKNGGDNGDNGDNENDKYLIATSEQPISCYHYNEWLEKDQFPIRYCGYSTCFRKEAGSAGKDLRGIFRVHQFEKIEQFCITAPEKSWEMHEEMLQISKDFLESLGIPYRVVAIVSGALNDAAAKKYDIEGWFPNTGEYRELVSCSNCTDYQSRKLKIRYGFKEKGEKATFAHMLNSTLCATERLMCCIMENYQTANGVEIPPVLLDYMPRVYKDKILF